MDGVPVKTAIVTQGRAGTRLHLRRRRVRGPSVHYLVFMLE